MYHEHFWATTSSRPTYFSGTYFSQAEVSADDSTDWWQKGNQGGSVCAPATVGADAATVEASAAGAAGA